MQPLFMTDRIEKCELVLTELSKFDDDSLHLGPPILDNRLEAFERQIGLLLPFDFKYLLKKHNGIGLSGTEVYGIDKELRGSSLDEVYHFEHDLVDNEMPVHYLPFSPDGFGNHYCLDLSKIVNGVSPVIFWQHDYFYKNLAEVEVCNNSFTEWMDEVMIGWTLDDYNYDGTEKSH
jgi:cell wall assembly regulator SMI1